MNSNERVESLKLIAKAPPCMRMEEPLTENYNHKPTTAHISPPPHHPIMPKHLFSFSYSEHINKIFPQKIKHYTNVLYPISTLYMHPVVHITATHIKLSSHNLLLNRQKFPNWKWVYFSLLPRLQSRWLLTSKISWIMLQMNDVKIFFKSRHQPPLPTYELNYDHPKETT